MPGNASQLTQILRPHPSATNSPVPLGFIYPVWANYLSDNTCPGSDIILFALQ